MQDDDSLPQKPLQFPIYSLFEQFYTEQNKTNPNMTILGMQYLEKLTDSLFTSLFTPITNFDYQDKQDSILQQNIQRYNLKGFLTTQMKINIGYFKQNFHQVKEEKPAITATKHMYLNSNKVPSFLEVQNVTKQKIEFTPDMELAELIYEKTNFQNELEIEVNSWDITGVYLTAASALYYGQEGYGDQFQKIVRRSAEYGK